MSFDILVLLFIAFSVISSLVNKWQERKAEMERQRRHQGDDTLQEETFEDASDWEVFRQPESRKSIQPEDPPETPREFREAIETPKVSEADTGPEFQEVRGATEITETDSGPEYRDPLAEMADSVRQVDVQEILKEGLPEVKEIRKRGRRRKGVRGLTYDRNALAKGILYREILGPPRGLEPPGFLPRSGDAGMG